uniref:CID domain-containing protein n=1 Tax=Timema monikensis TaxID=170555 RepID=A0A7R9EBW5_9NEOP|nr:unnamed protein product [Timema monikensis]
MYSSPVASLVLTDSSQLTSDSQHLVKVEHRLTLFYLANDVIQYSKRKNYEFVESWGTALQRATPMVRIEKVKHRILRIFKIWGERGVYDEAFITDLTGLLSTATKKPTAEPAIEVEFQPPLLIAKVRACMKLENDTDLKLKRLNESPLSFSDAEALRSHLKGKRQGDDMVSEVDEGIAKMQLYVNALDSELKERASLIDLLDQAEGFYNSQNGEAKIVATAYKNFGSRVKLLKRRLDEIIPTLKDSSPVPSPDINAPSPSPSGGSDFELPGEELLKGDEQFPSSFLSDVQPIQQIRMVTQEDSQSLDNCFASFMGNSLPFDLQFFLSVDSSGIEWLVYSPRKSFSVTLLSFHRGMFADTGIAQIVIKSLGFFLIREYIFSK